ncbi:MAG: amidohydrolase family protein [Firmicutes bacterium]|nr:amidohydrolase family protein [Bacillota bacterium]
MVIDMHAHYVPPEIIKALEEHPERYPNVKLTRTPEGGAKFQFPQTAPTRPVMPMLLDLEKRRAWMTQNRVDFQFLAGWLDIFGYTLSGEEATRWSRLLNESTAAAVAGEPARFAGLATVPLQDGEAAAEELRVAARLGLKGSMIGTWISGKDLDDSSLEPFWSASAELNMPVAIHPVYAGGGERLNKYGMPNIVGRPFETVLAAANLIFGGVLERHPGLKVILVHGGGYLPYQIGRLQRGYEVDGAARSKTKLEPVDAARALYYDHIVFHPRALRFLCDLVGADKVLLGSDYPFSIGDLNPLKVVDEALLTAAEAGGIRAENTRRIYKL